MGNKTAEKILDAAELCFGRSGVVKTTVKDIAEEADLSHMTVYRYYGDKEALFAAASLRILKARWELIASELSGVDTLSDWLVEALIINWSMMQEDEVISRYQQVGAHEAGMSVLLSEEGLSCLTCHFEHLIEAKGKRRVEQAKDIAEWLHWMSYVIASNRTERLKTKKDWRRWLIPQVTGGLTA